MHIQEVRNGEIQIMMIFIYQLKDVSDSFNRGVKQMSPAYVIYRVNETVNLIGGGSVIDRSTVAVSDGMNQTVSMCLPLKL